MHRAKHSVSSYKSKGTAGIVAGYVCRLSPECWNFHTALRKCVTKLGGCVRDDLENEPIEAIDEPNAIPCHASTLS